MAKKKTWQEKLADKKDLPKVIHYNEKNGKYGSRWGIKTGDTIVIPSPIEVDNIMKKIPPGKLTTIQHIREKLAKDHKTTIACPVTTGIFSWIAAHAAEEAKAEGKKEFTPYWRTLKTGGILNEKYPGGIPNLKAKLESEGHIVIQKGKKYMVENYEMVLHKL